MDYMNDSINLVLEQPDGLPGELFGDFIGILVLIEFGIVFFQCFENNEK